MNKQLLIVEESLKDLKGHWFEYIKTIADAAKKDGWDTDVASHANTDPHIAATLNTKPVFKHAKYLDNDLKPYFGEKYIGFIVHSIRVLKAIWPVLKKKKYDHVFMPTVLLHHLLAWYIIALFHPNRPKNITLFFITNPGIWDNETSTVIMPKKALLLKMLLRLFSPLVKKKRVTMALETEVNRREFEKLAGYTFLFLPHPVPFFKGETLAEKIAGSGGLTFSCLGFARHEKGSDLLKNVLLRKPMQSLNNNRFLIQWLDAFEMPDGTLCSNEELKKLDYVQLIETSLKEKEYEAYLKQTDCMILPYRNGSYYARVSRIAIEAISLGIPVIYTKGAWLEEVISKYGSGIGIEDESEADLANAIEAMAADFPEYKKNAMEKIALVHEYFTAENFCQTLLQK